MIARNESMMFAVKLADRFADGLRKRRLLKGRPDTRIWAAEIDHFLKSRSVSPHRFVRVMDWYVKNIFRTRRVPWAFSASTFCEKFHRIERRMLEVKYGRKKTITPDSVNVIYDLLRI